MARLGFSISPMGGDPAADIRGTVSLMARAHQAAIAKIGEAAKQQLRDDLRAAGIKPGRSRGKGQSLFNSWQSKFYPNKELDPAAFVYSNAPRILDWLANGPTIKAANGSYLAIPLPDAIARGLDRSVRERITGAGRRFGKHADLAGLNQLFGGKLKVIPLKDGSLLLAVATEEFTGRGYKARRAKRSEKTGIVPLFLLVKQVIGKKRITPDATVQRFYDLVPEILAAELDHVGLTEG